jgi:hypothetical protein
MSRAPESPNYENQSYGLLDNTPAFLFATVSPLLAVFIEANNMGAGILTFAVAETIAAILFIKGMPKKPKNELPKKPLAAENAPITIVNFKIANATN